MNTKYQKDVINFLCRQASVLKRPRWLSMNMARKFNKLYKHDESADSFYESAHKFFGSLHETNLSTLLKVTIVFIFDQKVIGEMRKELDEHKEFSYDLSDEQKIVRFTSEKLNIKEESGKVTKTCEMLVRCVPQSRKRKMIPESSSSTIDLGTIWEPQERLADGQKGYTTDMHRENQISQKENGVEESVKPSVGRSSELSPGVLNARRESNQLMGQCSPLGGKVFAIPKSIVPIQSIPAYELANGISSICYALQAPGWYPNTEHMIFMLTGSHQSVPLKRFTQTVVAILRKIYYSRTTRCEDGYIHVRDFLLVLKTSIIPLGVDIVTEALERIDWEIDDLKERDNTAVSAGGVAEIMTIPKDVVDWCISQLMLLVGF